MKKRILSLALTLILAVGLAIPASAHETDIVKVEAGLDFSLILTEGGDLYGCGSNRLGQLGDKVTVEYSPIGGYGVFRPGKITSGVTDMAASDHTSSQHRTSNPSGGHSMILKGDKLYTLGDNSCGQLGVGDREEHPGLQYIMDEVVAFDASGSSSAAVTEDGDLYFWGLLMGMGDYTDSQKPKKVLSGVKDVALGADFIVALKEDGTVWTMGDAYRGGLGNGMESGFAHEFSQVFSGAVAIAAGTNHALALKADGTLYTWGSNGAGQLGLDAATIKYHATPVYVMSGVKAIDCGEDSSYAIKTDDSLWCLGWNSYGEFGIGKQTSRKPAAWSAGNVAQVSGGYLYTMILKKDGNMYASGNNYSGQFGNGACIYMNLSWLPAGLTASPLPGANPFTDVAKDSYFYEPVLWARDNYITTGTTATTFSPHNTCTRAQIITFLWRAAGSPTPTITDDHPDVGTSDWFFDAVRWAAQNGVIPKSGNFNPNAPCTRAAAVEFMWKYAGSPSAGSEPFTDVDDAASYAEAVAWALEEGVTTGTTATTFAPGNTCTRAQIATFLYRAFA